MIRLTTVRHAATRGSAEHVINGHRDEPLSDEGVQQALELVDAIGRIQADVVVTSPLVRSIETARILTGLDASSMRLEPLAIERSYGDLEGIPPAEVAALTAHVTYVEAGGIRHSVNPPNGELLDDVRRRAEALLDALRDLHADEILLVAHQVIIQQLHGVLRGCGTVDAMGHDVRVLQIDAFELDGPVPARSHRRVHDGVRSLTSW